MSTYTSYSDERLLHCLSGGDKDAFNAIFSRYWKLLYNLAYNSLKDTVQSKEIVHDVLLDLWERRNNLEVNNLEAYLRKAIRFRVINYISRSKHTRFYELFDSIAASPHHPERNLFEKDMISLIESWIEILPEKRRQIFVKHFFEHLNTQEISQQLNISQKTVQNQLGTAVTCLYTRFSHLLSFIIFFFL